MADTIKKSISLPSTMFDQAVERAKKMKYPSFSEYVQFLIEDDLKNRPSHAVIRSEDNDAPQPSRLQLRAAETPPDGKK